jgi:hypothetical protein
MIRSSFMNVENDEKFIRGVESLVDPMDVSHLLFLQELRKMLPRPLFTRLLHRTARRTPYLGFVIEPYSLFLFFRLKDVERARSMLPDRYRLARSRIFADETPDYYLGVGSFGTRASTFWGVRQEAYLIAEDRETGLISWIFVGILSNTVIALPATGIANPNSRGAVFTTTSKGEILLDFKEDRTGRQLSLKGTITNGRLRELDEPLWLLGNTSIGHSRHMSNGDDSPFAVIFDPAEVERALDIPPEDITITRNTLFPGLAEPEPSRVLCFPFAQHYIADSPGCRTVVTDRADMIRKYNAMRDREEHRTFSSRTIKRELAIGTLLLAVIAAVLVLVT